MNFKERIKDWLFDLLFKGGKLSYRTADNVDFNKILYRRVLPSIEKYNRTSFPLENILCDRHDESRIKYDSGSYDFSRLGEGELPKPKIVWATRQKDTEKYGLNIGFTWDWLMTGEASSKKIMEFVERAKEQDRALKTVILFNTCLSSKMIYAFYNGEFTPEEKINRPPTYQKRTFEKYHNHYLALPRKEIGLTEITLMLEHVLHHGYGRGDFLLFCNHDLKKKINCFSEKKKPRFYPLCGGCLEGYVGKILTEDDREILCFETEWFPDKYFMLIHTRLPHERPLTVIEKKNPAARGLILAPGSREAYPIIDSAFIHWYEALVTERGAGVVTYLGEKWKEPDICKNVIEYDPLP